MLEKIIYVDKDNYAEKELIYGKPPIVIVEDSGKLIKIIYKIGINENKN